MTKEDLGRRVREERLQMHMTQEYLAEEVDVSVAFIGQIERGERYPSLQTMINLANALRTTVDYLLMDSIKPTNQNLCKLWIQLTKDMNENDMEMLIEIAKSISNHRK